ncbi:MAG: three-Cys-motif partner protein TcmP [Desulfuromonadales bacterium]|nr:three-Cys-motif partner protein TcmP [Desulfuromonadales bacterium]MDW7756162.1 three-Cys-motif partner protein TcmP [Desulfuromonadales bacterium]
MEMLKYYLGGREQAFIKHALLKAYLEKLFMIIGQRQRCICYVDCFSGPWEESAENLMDTSIGISLDIMAKCRKALAAMRNEVKFRALYIEKTRKSYDKLQDFLKQSKELGVETRAIRGEFHNNLNEIIDWCGSKDFVFFFVDPKGYANVIEPQTLEPLLHRKNSEILINFMYDHINRFVESKSNRNLIVDIFGEVPVVGGLEPKKREEYLLELYRRRLKSVMSEVGGVPRFAYVSVVDTEKSKTKYEMVYLTRHALGILKFLEVSEPLEIIQKQVKQKAKEHRSKQPSLFSFEEIPEVNEGVSIEEVKHFWLRKLSTVPEPFGYDRMADMHEETGWLLGDFQRAFSELLKEGKVQNIDMSKPRRSRPIHFEENRGEGERLRKLV